MSRRHVGRAASVVAVVALAATACVEDVTSPSRCPDFCPGGKIVTIESLLTTAIARDSSFRGYVSPHEAAVMLAATLPTVDSRPIFQTIQIATQLRIGTGSDTTTGPIVVDSAKLVLTLLRRDTAAHNLGLAFYRLPLGLDSTTTFAGLAPAFATPPLRVVNLDSLLALPGRRDSITGDSILVVDTVRHAVTVSLRLDTTQARYSAADSGRLAYGVRVIADTLASLALGATDGGDGPEIQWFNRVDSAGTLVARPPQRRLMRFDSFVFDPSPAPFDSNLTVGGVPAARALLRVALPRGIRDSSQIIRATLLLLPVTPTEGVPVDSFFINVRRVAADLSAKSPIGEDTIVANSAPRRPGPADTVRIEVTSVLRSWQSDTTAATAMYLRLLAVDRRSGSQLDGTEGGTFTALRLYSSRAAAFRPALRLTYVPRIKFGLP